MENIGTMKKRKIVLDDKNETMLKLKKGRAMKRKERQRELAGWAEMKTMHGG